MSLTYPIILNKSHYVGGSTFRYRFGTNVEMGNISVALGSCSVFFSWRNITAAKSNNTFRIVHPATGASNVNLDITIPDGGYEIDQLNNYLKWYLVSNGYFIQNNSTGDQTVYAQLRVNASTYQIEYVSYPLPTSLPSGFTAGSAITFPTTARGPQLVISNNLSTLLGFAQGTYPATQQSSIVTTGSTSAPVVSDVNNVVLTLNSALNPFAPNSTVIHSFSQAGTRYGGLITSNPNELSFVPQQQGFRQDLTVQLCDQMLRPIELIDSDVTIKLLLRREPNGPTY
jgi:hypothetical protein